MNVEVGGSFHLWRQRFPHGTPEQITFGPTEEEGLAVAPDGASLLTSVGVRRSSVWIHDTSGERALTSEGFAFAPQLSGDGRRVYYLSRQTAASVMELWTADLNTGRSERVLPGIAVGDFDISGDEREVAYTVRSPGGGSQVWVAALDRRSAPRRVTDGVDRVSFGPDDTLIGRALGERSNTLVRVKKDGTGRERIGTYAIIDKGRVSPDGRWIMAGVSKSGATGGGETTAIPLSGGTPVTICGQGCPAAWSLDGRYLLITVFGGLNGAGDRVSFGPTVKGRTLAIPVPAGRVLPELPDGQHPLDSGWTGPPGTRVIERSGVALGLDPSTYVFVHSDLQRNLFRIPLH